MVDVVRPPIRFRFRLLGERMNTYHGRNLTGQWLDEAFPHFHETTTPEDFITVAENAILSYRHGLPLLTLDKSHIDMERVFLPFRNGGTNVGLVMAHTIFC